MAGKRDYMPKKDDDFFNFQGSLVNKVVANKTTWAIPDAAVDALVSRRQEYEPLYHKSQVKQSRTSSDVLAHRQKRESYEKDIRTFVNAHIRFNDLISDSERLSLGMSPRDTEPTPKPKISDIPIVGLEPRGGGDIEVYCRRETDQDRPSMHPDADVVEVMFAMIPTHQPAQPGAGKREGLPSPEECPGARTSTRAHFIIHCGVKNAGKCFYGFFRWGNLTNPQNSGSWSNAKTVVIA
ncbi:MAG: hypothetical protein V1709_11950 [Planctomycetota bacterium]